MTQPPPSLLSPTFRYTPSYQTDIRKTFARVRAELAAQAAAKKEPAR